MSRSFFPTCSSLKVEMEMCKEMDDLRSEVEALTAECRAKSELADGLKRASAEQAARLREARAEVERQAREIAARDEEISSSGEARREVEARLAEKEQALLNLRAAHEGLKSSARERNEGLEAEKRGLVVALEESESRRLEQEAAARSSSEEVARLRRLLSEKDKKCSEAEQRALAPREVMMRDDMLLKLEEEKAAVQGKLKWKSEQFRHLEEALKKVQDEFRAAKKEWASDRSMLVDQIGTLEANLDSKTRMAEDFRSRLEMCSQALAHEEGRRKRLEAEMSELKHMYGSVVSDYEEARSTIELFTAKRDGEIASLRSSLAEKVTLLKEMEYGKARLEQENEDMRTLLKEYQEAQIGGADAVVSLKGLREKFRTLEQTHRSCTEKLRDKEAEWKTQMEKLVSDLDGCLSQLDSRDTLIRQLQNELLSSYSSLEMQMLQNWEASIVLNIVESKLCDSCLYFETTKVDMQKKCAQLEHNFTAAKEQVEEKNCAIAQSQAEWEQQAEVIATLHKKLEHLEYIEKEHEEMQRQLDIYKVENASRNVHCLKAEASEEESSMHEKLRKALRDLEEAHSALSEQKSELSQIEINLHRQKQAVEHLEEFNRAMGNELKGCKDENSVLKRDLIAKVEIEESLREEKEKLQGALNEANFVLSEKKSELRQSEINLHQQKQALEHLEELRVNMDTEIKGYIDENCALKRNLDVTHIAKMEAEKTCSEEKEKLLCALDEANCSLSDKKNELDQVRINLHQQMQAVERFEKLRVDMETELRSYLDENCVLKSDLVAALNAKMNGEDSFREEKDKLYSIIDGRCRDIEELQQHIAMLEEENLEKKLDVVGLIKSEVDRSVQEVNRKYSEIVEVFDKKLLELETRLSFFEQKYTCREQELMEMFDQEEADWYTLIAEKENTISEIQVIVESAQVDIKLLLEAAAEKLAEVQVEVKQLYGFAENLNSLNLVQEHDNSFKEMLIVECEKEVEALQMNLELEKEQSSNLKNALEQLKAKATAEMLEKEKEHLEVANKLKSYEERKEILEEHVGALKSRTKDMCNAFVQERRHLFDEFTGLADTIGAAVHVDEDLATSLTKIMAKVNNEAFQNSSSKEMLTSENKNVRSSPLVRNKSVHLPDRRSPLKEHNY